MSNIVNCPDCNRKISANVKICPWCGEQPKNQMSEKTVPEDKKSGIGFFPVVVALAFLSIAFVMLSELTDQLENEGSNNTIYSSDGYGTGTLNERIEPVSNNYQSDLERRKAIEQFRQKHHGSPLGIWRVRNYVNAFGDKTDAKYVGNTEFIRGKFSNSATENSALNVKFLINNANRMFIELYEYAGNNPVKGVYGQQYYTVLVQSSQKEVFNLEGRIHRGESRLTLINDDAQSLHKLLMNGGIIKFRITDRRTPSTKYNFDIDNADGYKNAFDSLLES